MQLKEIRDKLLKKERKDNETYIDGVLDMYNEIKKNEDKSQSNSD